MKLVDFIKELQTISDTNENIEITVERTDPCSNEYKYIEPYVYVEYDDEKARVIISADD